MNTPIADFVKAYAQSHTVRLHMPGHKGQGPLGVELFDITEIKGADSLYEADGIIAQSEKNASELFGAKATFYSTEGSSQCIRSMLWLVKQYASHLGTPCRIAACRNAHKTFVTAAALLGIEVDCLPAHPNATYLSCPIDKEGLTAYFDSLAVLPTALYVTSPDYTGNLLDIAALAKVCHERNILLVVDNAHGAYLKFLTPSLHPMDLGADLCCDSAHKTLPVLTGGAYLHIAQNAPDFFVQNAKIALSLFGSTSPSYLILQSLDLANAYLAKSYREKLSSFITNLDLLKEQLTQNEYTLLGNEPLKICIDAKTYGYRGDELAQYLRSWNIEAEFSDPDILVLMFTPEISAELCSRVLCALVALQKQSPVTDTPPAYRQPKRVMSAYRAISAPSETVSADQALGRVLAVPTVGCPPAVPILSCGEKIDEYSLSLCRYYGIDRFRVVKE